MDSSDPSRGYQFVIDNAASADLANADLANADVNATSFNVTNAS